MSTVYLFRRKTSADWTSANPVLMSGELGLETDTTLFKFGNGTTAWNSLAYAGASVGVVPWGAITGTLSAQTDLAAALAAKQATLVSGANIKTVGGVSILGAGDIPSGGGGSSITVKDEGSTITTALTTLDFVGAGVTVTGGATATVTIPGGAAVPDGDKGDITVSGSGTVWTIDTGAVTVSKMANMAASTILGNNTGAGAAPIALTVAQVKTLLAYTPADIGAATSAQANATHTGDATGATALTLATVNANVGAFGSATQVATFTVNAKGLTTAAGATSIAIPASQVTDFSEAVDDRVAALAVAGANMTITYNDVANTLTFAASGGGSSTIPWGHIMAGRQGLARL